MVLDGPPALEMKQAKLAHVMFGTPEAALRAWRTAQLLSAHLYDCVFGELLGGANYPSSVSTEARPPAAT